MTTSPTPLEGRTAVVFGGCGFIGSRVCSALATAGARVDSFDLRAPEQSERGVTPVVGDITDADAVGAAVEGADHIFALAGSLGALKSIAQPLADLTTSCTAQLVLLEAVRRLAPQATVVFAGSRLEYGAATELPVAESHPLRPESPYAIHKAACSAYYQMYAGVHGLRTTVLRLPNPYGVHVRGTSKAVGYGILNMLVDIALDGGCIPLYGGGLQMRDFVHIDDVAHAALAALAPAAAGRVFNIGSGEPHSLRDAAELIVSVCGSGTIDYSAPWPEAAAAVETGDFYFDISEARSVLGWSPEVGFEDGLVGVIAAMREGRCR